MNRLLLLIIGFGIFTVLSIYALPSLPSEWYGDITIEHRYVQEILSGHFPYRFILSAGPVYHYLIAPIIFVAGSTYVGYKLGSISVAICSLFLMYVLGKELGGRRVGITSSCALATLFPFIVFSRLGTSPHFIAVPLVIALGIAMVRIVKTGVWWWAVVGSVIATLGLLSYPSTFPFIGIWMIAVGYRVWTSRKNRIMILLLSGITLLIGVGLFYRAIVPDLYTFTNGYIGGKFLGSYPFPQAGFVLLHNLFRSIGMIMWSGDNLFRVNVPGRPMVDIFGTVLLCIGLITLVRKFRRKALVGICLWISVLIPASMPGIPSGEIPSSSRSLAILPGISLAIGFGIVTLSRFLSFVPDYLVSLCCLAILGYGSFYAYFVDYPKTLPHHNAPISRTIADEISRYPIETKLYIASCCYMGVASPDTESIQYSLLPTLRRTVYDLKYDTPSCNSPISESVLVISDPSQSNPHYSWESCFYKTHESDITGHDGDRYARISVYVRRVSQPLLLK